MVCLPVPPFPQETSKTITNGSRPGLSPCGRVFAAADIVRPTPPLHKYPPVMWPHPRKGFSRFLVLLPPRPYPKSPARREVHAQVSLSKIYFLFMPSLFPPIYVRSRQINSKLMATGARRLE